MTVYEINPLSDPRWPVFLERNPHASIFHSRGWLEALKCTYKYEPMVYTTSPPGADLRNGWAFCHIQSWLTGRRAVSLPFSDHCDPLVDDAGVLDALIQRLRQDQKRLNWKYVEYRSPGSAPLVAEGFEESQSFYLHRLDLHPSLDELFQSAHKDCTRRKIRRAQREGLVCEAGRSERLLDQFYRLLVLSRRRHQLPPQPRKWFSNLVDCLGSAATVRVVSHQGRPVASILTLRFHDTLIYKYGGSDARFHNLGGMHLCLWRAIEEAKASGVMEVDLGRSDLGDHGLIVFKDRWGADRTSLRYFRCSLDSRPAVRAPWRTLRARRVLAYAPGALLSAAGRILYRHLG